MSLRHHQSTEKEGGASNSGYGSETETSTLLVIATSNTNPVTTTITIGGPSSLIRMSSLNGPMASTSSSMSSSAQAGTSGASKPVLMRQDRTSTYLVSPQLSQTHGGSEESGGPSVIIDDENQLNARSVPDFETQYRMETPVISVSNSTYGGDHRGSIAGGYHIIQQNRCRSCCRTCDRRASTTPVSSLYLARSVSKESVRSVTHLSPSSALMHTNIPPVLITSSPTSGASRIIRQSSQPEASTIMCCGGHTCVHSHSGPNVSLRQLREASDGISGIVADSLRINGAMRPFKQV